MGFSKIFQKFEFKKVCNSVLKYQYEIFYALKYTYVK